MIENTSLSLYTPKTETPQTPFVQPDGSVIEVQVSDAPTIASTAHGGLAPEVLSSPRLPVFAVGEYCAFDPQKPWAFWPVSFASKEEYPAGSPSDANTSGEDSIDSSSSAKPSSGVSKGFNQPAGGFRCVVFPPPSLGQKISAYMKYSLALLVYARHMVTSEESVPQLLLLAPWILLMLAVVTVIHSRITSLQQDGESALELEALIKENEKLRQSIKDWKCRSEQDRESLYKQLGKVIDIREEKEQLEIDLGKRVIKINNLESEISLFNVDKASLETEIQRLQDDKKTLTNKFENESQRQNEKMLTLIDDKLLAQDRYAGSKDEFNKKKAEYEKLSQEHIKRERNKIINEFDKSIGHLVTHHKYALHTLSEQLEDERQVSLQQSQLIQAYEKQVKDLGNEGNVRKGQLKTMMRQIFTSEDSLFAKLYKGSADKKVPQIQSPEEILGELAQMVVTITKTMNSLKVFKRAVCASNLEVVGESTKHKPPTDEAVEATTESVAALLPAEVRDVYEMQDDSFKQLYKLQETTKEQDKEIEAKNLDIDKKTKVIKNQQEDIESKDKKIESLDQEIEVLIGERDRLDQELDNSLQSVARKETELEELRRGKEIHYMGDSDDEVEISTVHRTPPPAIRVADDAEELQKWRVRALTAESENAASKNELEASRWSTLGYKDAAETAQETAADLQAIVDQAEKQLGFELTNQEKLTALVGRMSADVSSDSPLSTPETSGTVDEDEDEDEKNSGEEEEEEDGDDGADDSDDSDDSDDDGAAGGAAGGTVGGDKHIDDNGTSDDNEDKDDKDNGVGDRIPSSIGDHENAAAVGNKDDGEMTVENTPVITPIRIEPGEERQQSLLNRTSLSLSPPTPSPKPGEYESESATPTKKTRRNKPLTMCDHCRSFGLPCDRGRVCGACRALNQVCARNETNLFPGHGLPKRTKPDVSQDNATGDGVCGSSSANTVIPLPSLDEAAETPKRYETAKELTIRTEDAETEVKSEPLSSMVTPKVIVSLPSSHTEITSTASEESLQEPPKSKISVLANNPPAKHPTKAGSLSDQSASAQSTPVSATSRSLPREMPPWRSGTHGTPAGKLPVFELGQELGKVEESTQDEVSERIRPPHELQTQSVILLDREDAIARIEARKAEESERARLAFEDFLAEKTRGQKPDSKTGMSGGRGRGAGNREDRGGKGGDYGDLRDSRWAA